MSSGEPGHRNSHDGVKKNDIIRLHLKSALKSKKNFLEVLLDRGPGEGLDGPTAFQSSGVLCVIKTEPGFTETIGGRTSTGSSHS